MADKLAGVGIALLLMAAAVGFAVFAFQDDGCIDTDDNANANGNANRNANSNANTGGWPIITRERYFDPFIYTAEVFNGGIKEIRERL